ncbi:hypothetical protein AMTRI_Chr07g80390 [Amborella trichopoda]
MASPNPPKPWKVEYAKSSRSSCKTCKGNIAKDVLRLGKMVQATQFDGFMPMWHHAGCIFKKPRQIKAQEDVEGFDLIRWDDQKNIHNYVENATSSAAAGDASTDYAIEASKSSRAGCKHCNEKIMKGEVRVSIKLDPQEGRGVAWHHIKCFLEKLPATDISKVPGWESLSTNEKESVLAIVKKDSTKKTKGVQAVPREVQHETTSKSGKRKKSASDGDKEKVQKTENTVTAGKVVSTESGGLSSDAKDLESKLEIQNRALWAIKDNLQKHVKASELREMLEANGQDSSGSEHDLRDRCADGMLFGALGSCSLCSGSVYYFGGRYKCHGYVSAWSKCAYSTTEPTRLKEKWKVPEDSDNEYLCKWFKSQKAKKPDRILPPSSSRSSNVVDGKSQLTKSESLQELKVAIVGMSNESLEEWKSKIGAAGGVFHMKMKKETYCLVVNGNPEEHDSEIRRARRMKISVVREEYLVDCINKKRRLPTDQYKIEVASETSRSGMVTVKVKGRSAVHEQSGLQDSGHILEDGKSIFNTTLNMSDLSTGINSYYILQIIQEDRGGDCYVFRKWGRVGNEKIGGNKLEMMSKSDAIREFKRLFLDKTGNSWEAWEQKRNFQKQPGRFFPLDIDYGVNKLEPRKNELSDVKSQFAPRLIELMKMLFNVETYRAAMMEFEINMSEMPLGKLSKSNIQKGFEALTEIQNLLSNIVYEPSVKESLIVDASNRFFTVIPSIHPHVIRDENDFKSKVKMLEALQDIEIASRLVGFDSENDESLDEKYKKLCCDVAPLPHDSTDYQMVKKFLLNTHAPTHKDWTLEVEDVFALERDGEFDKYAPYRDNLKNKMLLWHGSRLTNFVGILSQGLRIAPPEAPSTGYMFGKGVYFADLVSKSAQYCYTDKKDAVGLLLLSEVALGEMYELKKAKYMESPPEGKHSTKGLGQKTPNALEFEKWRDEITVPCGSPVSSGVRATELMYNEYIVYNTAQVKMQFLLKVRFHHKR